MAQPSRNDLAALTRLAEENLDHVRVVRLESNSDRALWEVHGAYKNFDIRLKEVFTRSGRMYSYYILNQGEVVVGFDNYPDRRALQQKYADDFKAHLFELIPHKHGPRKATFELTEEMTLVAFLDYLHQHA